MGARGGFRARTRSRREGKALQSPAADPATTEILRELRRDARTSMRALGSAVGLSPPAVTERVRRLEDIGVIRGYRAAIDPAKLGYGVTAFLSITARDGRCDQAGKALSEIKNVLALYHVAGPTDFVARVVARDLDELKAITEQLADFGSVTTQIVLGTTFERDLDF
jgi:Lrp/AsnC family leucine-responsive transcriptional regulator